MDGRPLSHLELLTIATKDEQYYKQWLGDNTQELAQRFLGVRRWIQFRNAVTVASRFGYFALTSIPGGQTLGEEFCEAKVVKQSALKSLMMAMLNNELQLPKEIPRSFLRIIKDVNLVTFFLFADFYELSKRITDYYYITSDDTKRQSKSIDLLYHSIGCMSLLKLLVEIRNNTDLNGESVSGRENVSEEINDRESTHNKDQAKVQDPNMICHLCSSTRQNPTSTFCGHIFCWTCIHKWLKERFECPICRSPTDPTKLVHLINFK